MAIGFPIGFPGTSPVAHPRARHVHIGANRLEARRGGAEGHHVLEEKMTGGEIRGNPDGKIYRTHMGIYIYSNNNNNNDNNNVNPGLINPGLLIRGVLLQ